MGTSCENCGHSLAGPYCSICGQHAHASARSLTGLLHDAWHDLTHIEGRFWATLQLLLMRPGQLTLEYFAGRRARYAAPFRLYLVISVLFFALSSLTGRLDAHGEGNVAHVAVSQNGSADEKCDDIRMDSAAAARFMRHICERVAYDNGRSLSHEFAGYVPKTMFVFLPLVAGILALLYRRPKRFYVEHLVLVLHNHAAAFGAMALAQLLHIVAVAMGAAGLTSLQNGIQWLHNTFDLVLVAYVPWYTYQSLRRFYGLSAGATWLRLLPLGMAYLLFLGVTFGGTFLLTAWLS